MFYRTKREEDDVGSLYPLHIAMSWNRTRAYFNEDNNNVDAAQTVDAEAVSLGPSTA
jgi:hypothetical protein